MLGSTTDLLSWDFVSRIEGPVGRYVSSYSLFPEPKSPREELPRVRCLLSDDVEFDLFRFFFNGLNDFCAALIFGLCSTWFVCFVLWFKCTIVNSNCLEEASERMMKFQASR